MGQLTGAVGMNGRQLFMCLEKRFILFEFFSSALKWAFLKELLQHPFTNPEVAAVSHLEFVL